MHFFCDPPGSQVRWTLTCWILRDIHVSCFAVWNHCFYSRNQLSHVYFQLFGFFKRKVCFPHAVFKPLHILKWWVSFRHCESPALSMYLLLKNGFLFESKYVFASLGPECQGALLISVYWGFSEVLYYNFTLCKEFFDFLCFILSANWWVRNYQLLTFGNWLIYCSIIKWQSVLFYGSRWCKSSFKLDEIHILLIKWFLQKC